jgi:MFS transporter, DHA2 family, multidrug resistance protein
VTAIERIDRPRRILISAAIMVASVMQVLDTTIANVALPHIQGSLSATQDQVAWILTSYIVAAAIMTPLVGWLSGAIGRRRVFLISTAGFTIASMLCGLAQNLPEIVAARMVQGICGAALVPISQAILLDINPPEQHIKAMGLWSMAITLGPILGPACGGWLTEYYNWRWVFYINLPFGIFAFFGAWSAMPETKLSKSSFDFVGFAALSLAVGALQLTLDRGPLKDWFSSTEICIEATLAAVAFYVFVVHMFTARRRRFLEPALFRDRNFVTGCVFITMVGVVMYGTLALLPALLQGLMNYPVVTTGLVTAPRGFGGLFALILLSRLNTPLDARWVIGAGFAFVALSAWQMTQFDLQMSEATVMWSGIAQGIGSGLIFVPLASAAFATLNPVFRNEGTALFSLCRNLGSSVGISIVEALLTRNTQIAHSSLSQHVSPFNPAVHAAMEAGTTAHALTQLNAEVTRQAAMIAYLDNFKLLMWLSVGVIPAVLLLRKQVRPSERALDAVIE